MTINPYKVGSSFYLTGLAELAVFNFFKGDFGMTRPKALPEALQFLNPAMAYVTGALLLVCVIAIFLNRYRRTAVLSIVVIIFLCATSRHLLNLWTDNINGYKSLWLPGGALLLLYFDTDYIRYRPAILWTNIVIVSLFFFSCGFVHLQIPDLVQNLIPSFIPFHMFFTVFAGICLLSAGLGLLLPPTQKAAALLSGIQIFGWFLLLHIPLALNVNGDEWIGPGESLAISGICFMFYGILKTDSSKSSPLAIPS